MVCCHCMRGLLSLFPNTEQAAQQAPHPLRRTPNDDLHALTSCPSCIRSHRRSAETPPETSALPRETRRRSESPAPVPPRRDPKNSRPLFSRYIPPLLQYMKSSRRSAWHSACCFIFSFFLPRLHVLQLIKQPQVALVAADGNVAVLHRLQDPAALLLRVGAAGEPALPHVGRELRKCLR